MAAVIPQSYRETPVTTPLVGTLLDAATVVDGVGWIDTEGIALSYNCIDLGSQTAWPCPDTDPPAKTFNELGGYQDGFKFVSYGGIKCRSVGFDEAEATREVRRVFESKESVAVAANFMSTRFIASAGNWAAPTDLTPAAGAVSPKVGVGILEQAAGVTYAGTPTIHTSRLVGALLWESVPLNERAGVYYSPQGSKIAADPGYGIDNQSPAGVNAPAGESWMYVTGEVIIARGALHGPTFTLSQGNAGIDDNEVRVLIERPYIAWIDCFAAAVRVKVE